MNQIVSANCPCGVDCQCTPCYCNAQDQVKALDGCTCDPCHCGSNCQCGLGKKVAKKTTSGCQCGDSCACVDCQCGLGKKVIAKVSAGCQCGDSCACGDCQCGGENITAPIKEVKGCCTKKACCSN